MNRTLLVLVLCAVAYSTPHLLGTRVGKGFCGKQAHWSPCSLASFSAACSLTHFIWSEYVAK